MSKAIIARDRFIGSAQKRAFLMIILPAEAVICCCQTKARLYEDGVDLIKRASNSVHMTQPLLRDLTVEICASRDLPSPVRKSPLSSLARPVTKYKASKIAHPTA